MSAEFEQVERLGSIPKRPANAFDEHGMTVVEGPVIQLQQNMISNLKKKEMKEPQSGLT